jgi:hypothetical protein
MLVNYELYDKEGEALMSLQGKEYIAPVGSDVCFHDDEISLKEKDQVALLFNSKVTSHVYYIDEDTLWVNCEVIEDLTEKDESDLLKYHKFKYEKQ